MSWAQKGEKKIVNEQACGHLDLIENKMSLGSFMSMVMSFIWVW